MRRYLSKIFPDPRTMRLVAQGPQEAEDSATILAIAAHGRYCQAAKASTTRVYKKTRPQEEEVPIGQADFL